MNKLIVCCGLLCFGSFSVFPVAPIASDDFLGGTSDDCYSLDVEDRPYYTSFCGHYVPSVTNVGGDDSKKYVLDREGSSVQIPVVSLNKASNEHRAVVGCFIPSSVPAPPSENLCGRAKYAVTKVAHLLVKSSH